MFIEEIKIGNCQVGYSYNKEATFEECEIIDGVKGGVNIKFTPAYYALKTDKSYLAQKYQLTDLLVQIEFTSQKMSAEVQKIATPFLNYDETTKKYTLKENGAMIDDDEYIKIIVRPLGNTDNSNDSTFYKCVNKGEVNISHKHDQERLFEYVFEAMYDDEKALESVTINYDFVPDGITEIPIETESEFIFDDGIEFASAKLKFYEGLNRAYIPYVFDNSGTDNLKFKVFNYSTFAFENDISIENGDNIPNNYVISSMKYLNDYIVIFTFSNKKEFLIVNLTTKTGKLHDFSITSGTTLCLYPQVAIQYKIPTAFFIVEYNFSDKSLYINRFTSNDDLEITYIKNIQKTGLTNYNVSPMAEISKLDDNILIFGFDGINNSVYSYNIALDTEVVSYSSVCSSMGSYESNKHDGIFFKKDENFGYVTADNSVFLNYYILGYTNGYNSIGDIGGQRLIDTSDDYNILLNIHETYFIAVNRDGDKYQIYNIPSPTIGTNYYSIVSRTINIGKVFDIIKLSDGSFLLCGEEKLLKISNNLNAYDIETEYSIVYSELINKYTFLTRFKNVANYLDYKVNSLYLKENLLDEDIVLSDQYDDTLPTIKKINPVTLTDLTALEYIELAGTNLTFVKIRISIDGGTTWKWFNDGIWKTSTSKTESNYLSELEGKLQLLNIDNNLFNFELVLLTNTSKDLTPTVNKVLVKYN